MVLRLPDPNVMRPLAILCVLLSAGLVCPLREYVNYTADGVTCEGFVAYNSAVCTSTALCTAVVILHDQDGLTDYERKRSCMLYDLGYVAFAADIYGVGVTNTTDAAATHLANSTLYLLKILGALTQVSTYRCARPPPAPQRCTCKQEAEGDKRGKASALHAGAGMERIEAHNQKDRVHRLGYSQAMSTGNVSRSPEAVMGCDAQQLVSPTSSHPLRGTSETNYDPTRQTAGTCTFRTRGGGGSHTRTGPGCPPPPPMSRTMPER